MTLQCGTKRVIQPSDAVRNILPAQLAEMLRLDNPPVILDVREPAELRQTGAIENARNIPVGLLPSRLEELPRDLSTPIVCVCATGGRSLEASHFLTTQGYTTVMNLSGGTMGWIKEGNMVYKPVETAR